MMASEQDSIDDVLNLLGFGLSSEFTMAARRTDPHSLARRPARNELLHELSEFLIRLDDLTELARRSARMDAVELPMRRLSDDLMRKADVASVHAGGRMTFAYSLAMQEAARHLEAARQTSDRQQWLRAAELTREALQRAVVRVRRLYD